MGASVVVGWWWNQRFGRLTRRDIWRRRNDDPEGEPVRWMVEIRRGDEDGERADWTFDREYEARAWVERCLETGGDGWKEFRY